MGQGIPPHPETGSLLVGGGPAGRTSGGTETVLRFVCGAAYLAPAGRQEPHLLAALGHCHGQPIHRRRYSKHYSRARLAWPTNCALSGKPGPYYRDTSHRSPRHGFRTNRAVSHLPTLPYRPRLTLTAHQVALAVKAAHPRLLPGQVLQIPGTEEGTGLSTGAIILTDAQMIHRRLN